VVKALNDNNLTDDQKMDVIREALEVAIENNEPDIRTVEWDSIKFDDNEIYQFLEDFKYDKELEKEDEINAGTIDKQSASLHNGLCVINDRKAILCAPPKNTNTLTFY
jgi:hypothetical protein